MDHFVELLQSHNICLRITEIPRAIKDFEEEGTLQKIRILFRGMAWKKFVLEGAPAALKSEWMPQYMDDILAWYHEEECSLESEDVKPQALLPEEESSCIMRLNLQLCSAPDEVVCKQMQKLPHPNLDDKEVITCAIESSLATIVYVTPAMREHHDSTMASYLHRLRDGWGIRYPAALLTIVVQEKHGEAFQLPALNTLCYTDASDDAALAGLFSSNKTSNMQESSVLQLGQLVQNFYDPEQWMQLCIHGPEAFLGHEVVQPTIDLDGLLQDVGHP